MGTYIISTCAISPQHTFVKEDYLKTLIADDTEYKKCIDPEYKTLIDPKLLRRMSRIIKMGVASALHCINSAQIEKPSAIIVGTGLGCLDDTEKFLASMVLGAGIQSPTPFIQSTHNTIAGQISLLLNCNAYSMTFAQRGHSFENALQDAIFQIEQGKNNVLVGGIDEVTPTSSKILQELNCHENPTKTSDITGNKSIGEGACFFLLSANPDHGAMAELVATETFYSQESFLFIQEKITEILGSKGIELHELDGVILGSVGIGDTYYDHLSNTVFKGKSIYSYKHLCGEYFTANAFGMELGVNMLRNQCDYAVTQNHKEFRYILIYNHLNYKYHSVVILKKWKDS